MYRVAGYWAPLQSTWGNTEAHAAAALPVTPSGHIIQMNWQFLSLPEVGKCVWKIELYVMVGQQV